MRDDGEMQVRSKERVLWRRRVWAWGVGMGKGGQVFMRSGWGQRSREEDVCGERKGKRKTDDNTKDPRENNVTVRMCSFIFYLPSWS